MAIEDINQKQEVEELVKNGASSLHMLTPKEVKQTKAQMVLIIIVEIPMAKLKYGATLPILRYKRNHVIQLLHQKQFVLLQSQLFGHIDLVRHAKIH